MKKLSVFLSFAILLFVACEKEDEIDKVDNVIVDIYPPHSVSDLETTPMNQAIKLTWRIPSDYDFKLTRIKFNGETFDIEKSKSEKVFEGLENGKQYVFKISTLDNDNNESESIEISDTPDKYVTVINGKAVSSGEYKEVNSNVSVTIDTENNEYKRVEVKPHFKFIWEGKWKKENDTTYLYNLDYSDLDHNGQSHIAYINSKINIALSYSYSDSIFYVERIYEKKEGPEGLLPGKYQSYIIDESSDDSSYDDKIINEIEINEGALIYYTNGLTTQISTWSNEDILNGKFIFVSYNSRTYLVVRGINQRYYKEQ